MQDEYALPPPPIPSPPSLPSPLPSRGHPRLAVMLLFLVGLVCVLVFPYLAQEVSYAIARGRARAEAEVSRALLADAPPPDTRYRTVVKAVLPSVVAVEMVRFGQRSRDNRQPAILGQGSGVIVDPAGYIVTNAHVVRGASEIHVTLNDGEVINNVNLVGADLASDIAVLKIDPGMRTLVSVKWGDSDKLEVGDPVLAIGSPYGLEQSVTAGIVSAKNRRAVDREQRLFLQDFLQTDAAVNPGNSGGPLVDLRGELIGINTAIYGPSYQGIAFAIPSRMAQQVYDKLKAGEPITHGWLGVGRQEVSETLAEQLGLDRARGALVTQVVPDSPAQKAGIQVGDVIVKWGDLAINNSDDLLFLVASTQPGSRIKVEYYRSGQKEEATVTVGERRS